MKAMLVRSVFVVAALSASAMAQSTWTQVVSSGPSARYGPALAYDSQRGKTVLFGGTSGSSLPYGDTWEWDGTAWVQVATSGPSGRFSHSMAFDSQRGRTVLVGGMGSGGTLVDTWEWDGTSWALVNNSGPGGVDLTIAYDSQRGKLVLCGPGQNCPTWEWNIGSSSWVSAGTLWVTAGSIEIVFDSQRGKTVLFSSANVAGEWDGITWTAVPFSIPQPQGRSFTAVAYDTIRSKTVMFGGYTTGLFYGDTWQWSGTSWSQVAIAGPAARGWHAMAYDSQRNRTVMFGGQNNGGALGDTWELVTPVAVASAQTYGSGCGSPAVTLAPHPGSRPLVGQSQVCDINNASLGIAFVAWGLSNQFWGTTPLPVSLDPFGFAGCMLWHSAEGELGMGCASTSWNTAQHTMAIPFAPAFVGARVYLQAWTIAPGFNPAGIVTSNGVELVLGNI